MYKHDVHIKQAFHDYYVYVMGVFLWLTDIWPRNLTKGEPVVKQQTYYYQGLYLLAQTGSKLTLLAVSK